MIFPEGTQEVRLTQNARKLTALTRSENPPIVKVLELRKIAEEKYLLRTGITDLDGDVPDVVVAYSANRGKTWLRLAGAKPSTVAKLVLDTSSLPGSDRGIIEVTASDGLNCAKARASISVPDRSPRVIAVGSLAPRDKEGQATYRVAAYDPEDGLLSGSSISWTTLEGVPLGSGGRLTTKHKPGDLRVVAVDSKGNRTAVRLIDVPK